MFSRPPDRAGRPAGSACAIGAHRPRPDDPAGEPRATRFPHRPLARVVRAHRVARRRVLHVRARRVRVARCARARMVPIAASDQRHRGRAGRSPGTTTASARWCTRRARRRVHGSAPTLFLADDHTGHTDLCSLFLDQSYRHAKNGPLARESRLLFIAEFATDFAPNIIAEPARQARLRRQEPVLGGSRPALLRDGILDGRLPDRHRPEIVRRGADAAPPGLRERCCPSPRATSSATCTPTPRRARMLEQEGFRDEGDDDIFDGGPTVEGFRQASMRVARSAWCCQSRLARRTRCRTASTDYIPWLVCNRFADFWPLSPRFGEPRARGSLAAARVRRRCVTRRRG